jgi:5-methylcytosine-specific restriction endonuclease McrA
MRNYSENDKVLVWNMGTIVPGYDQNKYRRDRCGAWMAWTEYGNRDSAHGWEIDHIVPISRGGQHVINNAQPLHWRNNAAKADGPLVCAVR